MSRRSRPARWAFARARARTRRASSSTSWRASRATRHFARAAGPPPDEARAAALPSHAPRALPQPPRRELRLDEPFAFAVAVRFDVPVDVADAGHVHRDALDLCAH